MVYLSSSLVMMWLVGCFSVGTWSLIKSDETCDGEDNDLDGSVDEGFEVQYADVDGDGFGDPAAPMVFCEDASGFVLDDGDCNDGDASVNPDAVEVCDDVDNNCDGVTDNDAIDARTYYTDEDGDGFGNEDAPGLACEIPLGALIVGGDCDDGDANLNPGAAEVCDGVDNNCDGHIDDDDPALDLTTATTWYRDLDGDGHGDVGEPREACLGAGDESSLGDDCDVDDAGVSPSAQEICGGVDEDCDGLIDDEDDSIDPASRQSWYYDYDGDGYGAAVAPDACDAPSEAVAEGGDCDDERVDVNLDASEVCDAADNDCDGLTDDDDPTLDLGTASTWYLDGDSDGFGDALSLACEAPSGALTVGGDCDDGDASVNPDAVELCNSGVDEDCDGSPEPCGVEGALTEGDADYTILGAANSSLGYDMAVGDLNGDGEDDLVVSAHTTDVSSSLTNVGAVYIVYGPIAADLSLPADADLTMTGVAASDNTGRATSAEGDVNGDGVDDLLVSADTYDPDGRSSAGGVALVYGSVSGRTGALTFTTGDALWPGAAASDSLGRVAQIIGDFNGDGYDDIVIGGSGIDLSGSSSGGVYVFPGTATKYSGWGTTSSAVLSISGVSAGDQLGYWRSVSGPVDLDGDGFNELVLGAWFNDDASSSAGAVYLIYGNTYYFGSGGLSVTANFADAIVTGVNAGENLGTQVSGVGDTDGDGYDELIVGGTGANPLGVVSAGCAWLLPGGSARYSGTDYINTHAIAEICGVGTSDYISQVTYGGDLNGDAYSDLVVASSWVDVGSTSDAGAAYVFFGPVSGSYLTTDADASLSGSTHSGNMGLGGTIMDYDGDGADDLLIGAYGASAAYIWRGGGL